MMVLLYLPMAANAEAIDQYHTRIIIHPTGSLSIQETIRYDFETSPRHGIYRDIPLSVRLSPYAPEVSIGLSGMHITVDGKESKSVHTVRRVPGEGRQAHYRIGDPDITLTGIHTYLLSYDVAHGVYPTNNPQQEAIRWNAVGAGSSVPVHHAKAQIILPTNLDRRHVKLQAWNGTYGSTNSRAICTWIDDRRASCEIDALAPHEALTVELAFDAGALGERSDLLRGDIWDYLRWYWHIPIMILMVILFWRYAHHLGVNIPDGIIMTRYRPPKLSVLQSGLLLNKFADDEDLTAAIVELGALGYLTMEHDSNGQLQIVRTNKPIDSNSLTSDQIWVLDGVLFADGDMFVPQKATHSKSFADALETLKERLYIWSQESGHMRDNPDTVRHRFLGWSVLVVSVPIVMAIYDLIDRSDGGSVIGLLVALVFASIGVYAWRLGTQTHLLAWKFFGGVWVIAGIFGIVGLLLDDSVGISLVDSPLLILPLSAGLIWYGWRHIGAYTSKGAQIYRHLLGYRRFIGRVDADRLRLRLERDPLLLQQGLAYAVLFGLQKHWLELYKKLDIPIPSWWSPELLNDLNKIDSALILSDDPATFSSSGGWSGGGSYAGGGGGGGGVGSW